MINMLRKYVGETIQFNDKNDIMFVIVKQYTPYAQTDWKILTKRSI